LKNKITRDLSENYFRLVYDNLDACFVKARLIGWLFIACPMKTIDLFDSQLLDIVLTLKEHYLASKTFPLISDI